MLKSHERTTRWLALAAALWLTMPASAQPAPTSKPTDDDWTAALKAVKQFIADGSQPPERRGNAVVAYAKLLMLRGQGQQVVGACKEFFSAAGEQRVAEAAVRAACMATQQADGHLGGAYELVAAWKAGATGHLKNAVEAVNVDLAKVSNYLMELAARKMTPAPIAVGPPPWMPGRGGGGINLAAPTPAPPAWVVIQPTAGAACANVATPLIAPPAWTAKDAALGYCPALKLTLPVYAPPDWYGRVTFPPLTSQPGK